MLRIAGPQPPQPPPPDPTQDQPLPTDQPQDPGDGGGDDQADAQPQVQGMVSPESAGYMGADQGPFECQRCSHFESPDACSVVGGPIDPQGCCNLFDPAGEAGSQGADQEAEAAEPPAEEAAESPQDEGKEPAAQ